MQNKKILIIGDSNTLPHYNKNKEDLISVEDVYVNLLIKELSNFQIEKTSIGGITTEQLFYFSIPYYASWVPDYIIVHSGINDIKSQIIKSKYTSIFYKFFSFFKVKKSFLKKKFIYNKSFLKHTSTPKVPLSNFRQQAIKLRNVFSNSKIFWIEIHSDKRINNERPNTFERLTEYNKTLKDIFGLDFVELNDFDISNFTSDGYHLNKKGQFKLFHKLKKMILSSD